MSGPLVLTDAELVVVCGDDVASPTPTLDGLDEEALALVLDEARRSLSGRVEGPLTGALTGLGDSPHRVVVEQLAPRPEPDAVAALTFTWIEGSLDAPSIVLTEQRTDDGRHVFAGLLPDEVLAWLGAALGIADAPTGAAGDEVVWRSVEQLTEEGPLPVGHPWRAVVDAPRQVLASVQTVVGESQRLVTAYRSADAAVVVTADPSDPRGAAVRRVAPGDLPALLWPRP